MSSPVDGYVTNLLAHLGDFANAGANTISVVDANSFWVKSQATCHRHDAYANAGGTSGDLDVDHLPWRTAFAALWTLRANRQLRLFSIAPIRVSAKLSALLNADIRAEGPPVTAIG